MSTYKSAFIIPKLARKILHESGWTFETEDRLKIDVLNILREKFSLKEMEKYLGIEVYVGDGIKVSVVYDENHLIEEISIQLRTVSPDELKIIFHNTNFGIEIFVPSEDAI